MSVLRTARKGLLAAALSASLALPTAQAVQAAPPDRPPAAPPAARTAVHDPHDDVDRLARPPKPADATPVPGGGKLEPGRIPGDLVPGAPTPPGGGPALAGGVPCTLDGVTRLTPDGLADFLTDLSVYKRQIWTWDARLAPVMSRAHVQAVAGRAARLAPRHDGTDATHLLELFTYLHAAVYHDFSRTEIDLTDAPTVDAMSRAVAALGAAAHTFDPTRQNAETLREALTAGSATGLRRHQLGLVRKVLGTMAPGSRTAADPAWGNAVLAALTVNYLGICLLCV